MENKDFEDKVKRSIENTGLPTEITATKVLTQNGWLVKNELPYFDAEIEKVRTLDIKAEKTIYKNAKEMLSLDWTKTKDAIHCELFIECKKSTKPWVFSLDTLTNADLFFKIERLTADMSTDIFNGALEAYKQSIADPKIIENGKRPKSIFTMIPPVIKSLDYKIGISHQIALINNKENDRKNEEPKDEIYSAEMQLFKTLKFQEEKGKKSR
jgi:hypothetical protein